MIALMTNTSLSPKDKISDVFLSVDMFRNHLSTKSVDPYKERMIDTNFDSRTWCVLSTGILIMNHYSKLFNKMS